MGTFHAYNLASPSVYQADTGESPSPYQGPDSPLLREPGDLGPGFQGIPGAPFVPIGNMGGAIGNFTAPFPLIPRGIYEPGGPLFPEVQEPTQASVNPMTWYLVQSLLGNPLF